MTTTPDAVTIDQLHTLIGDQIALIRRGDVTAAAQLADLWQALDQHLQDNGALPAAWQTGAPTEQPLAISETADGAFALDFTPQLAPPSSSYHVVSGARVAYDVDAFLADALPAQGDAPQAASQLVKGRRRLTRYGTLDSPVSLRADASDTSRAAAERAALRAHSKNQTVFWLVYDSPEGLADHEIEAKLGLTHQSASSVRNRLMNAGYLEDSHKRRNSGSGLPSIVWTVTEWARARVACGKESRPASRAA